jgi:hypothetical protein
LEFSDGVKWKYGGAGVAVDPLGVSIGIKVDDFWVGEIIGVTVDVTVVVLQPTSMSAVMVDNRTFQM